jgi:Protein of unknown function (DUF1488)
MLILADVPDAADAQFWEHTSRSDASMDFVRWPADVGSKHIIVRISTRALSDHDGEKFEIDTGKVKAALERHRDFIQRLARSKYKQGDNVVTLDVGDFRLG